MLLPILVLFITGCITQAQAQTQTETTDDKLDKLLTGQEFQGRVTASVCQRLENEATSQRQALDDKLDSVILAANEFNQTLNHLLEENETLRKRQAAAAAISVTQLLIVIIYLLVIGVSYLVKCFKKQQEKQLVENLELMEARLQDRKNKMRSASRPPKEQ